jgi:hypothetical protein
MVINTGSAGVLACHCDYKGLECNAAGDVLACHCDYKGLECNAAGEDACGPSSQK